MKKDATFSDVIDSWPSKNDFAEDINMDIGSVNNWYYRKRIPSEHWYNVLAAAEKRNLAWRDEDFVLMAARFSYDV